MNTLPTVDGEADLDAALEDSFPASDPPSSSDPSRGITGAQESLRRPVQTEEAQIGKKPPQGGGQ
jgi:hypothetical protein